MSIRARLSGLIRSSSIEFIAIWFAFRDRRVRWYVKLVLVHPLSN